jgi:glycine/serine hydroxymethyltransferase
MAKQSQKPHASRAPEARQLAERLFAANWRIGSGFTNSHLAGQCIDAADAFYAEATTRDTVRRADAG